MSSVHITDDFDIITTLLSDRLLLECSSNAPLSHDGLGPSQFYMLDFHRDRLLNAIQAFKWPKACQIQVLSLKDSLEAHLMEDMSKAQNPLRLRVALSFAGNITISSMKTEAVPPSLLFPTSLSSLFELSKHGSLPNFRIVMSSGSTEPTLFTSHKTSWRKHYNEIRAELPSKGPNAAFPEILLFNLRGEIMEGSICTPFFLRGGDWITPDRSCGGNMGTTRRYALERGLCKEGVVMKDSVKIGDRVILSNGVRGFGFGFVEDLEKGEREGATART